MSRFIHGLGIRNVGAHLSKILENKFNSKLDDLISASFDDLISIDEVGDIIANSIIQYFKDENNLKEINQCFELGVVFEKTIQTFMEPRFTITVLTMNRVDSLKRLLKSLKN